MTQTLIRVSATAALLGAVLAVCAPAASAAPSHTRVGGRPAYAATLAVEVAAESVAASEVVATDAVASEAGVIGLSVEGVLDSALAGSWH